MDEAHIFPIVALSVLAGFFAAPFGHAADGDPLQLEAKIALGAVAGRIDHMAIDLGRQRLFVAELGNGSVGVVDLKDRKVIHRINELKEPQGIGFVPFTDTIYIASGGDGSLRMFRGSDYEPTDQIDLGKDADNVRFNSETKKVFVGYGSGALAVIDPASRRKTADIPLKAHPESFQLGGDNRIFVNLPDAKAIAAVDAATGQEITTWRMSARGNYPMVLDRDAQRIIAVFRSPSRLTVFAMRDGAVIADVEVCGDADDVFFDRKRHRVYVSCGAGFIDVFEVQAGTYSRIARISTVPGARTSLFVPELDSFFVAVRASGKHSAAIWIYRALP